jgi:hypothetical protein
MMLLGVNRAASAVSANWAGKTLKNQHNASVKLRIMRKLN